MSETIAGMILVIAGFLLIRHSNSSINGPINVRK
jgi:hypothetical protein